MFGEIISAGANLLNGFLNRNAQEQFNAQQLALAHENLDFQKQAAHEGIQWKVADAKLAGIHPLAALGAQTFSPSPVTAGGEAAKWNLDSVGQDVSRAAKALADTQVRKAVDEVKSQQLDNEGKALDNDIKRTALASSIARTSQRSGQIGPPIPRPGPTRTVGGVAVGDDDLKQKAEDFPATKVVRPFGYSLDANPWFNDGQQFEDRYGDSEIGSTIKFGVNTIADHLYTGYNRWPWVDRGQSPTQDERRQFMRRTQGWR